METSKPDSGHITRCPLTAAVSAIGGKWKLIILWWLKDEPRHFGELRRLMPRITHKVLAQKLRELQGDGLIHRDVQNDALRRVKYSLTDHGRSVQPLLTEIRRWGFRHLERGVAARSASTAQTPGSE